MYPFIVKSSHIVYTDNWKTINSKRGARHIRFIKNDRGELDDI